ncbi:MAG: ATP-binding protein [Candidatus Hydrogenedentes bacterium]|nr:ATP-binding protein [Candidatus Hydrogenedentota bacterium]
MDYDRERRMAEARAKVALADSDWKMVAYHLFNAARMTSRMAHQAEGRTRDSLVRLAQAYEQRGDRALAKVGKGGAKDEGRAKVSQNGRQDTDVAQQDWVVSTRPDIRLDDVAGMGEMKDIIQSHIVLPMKHADVYAQYGIQPGSGVLMYGPPGTGKTFVASAIAGEVDAAFIPVEMKKVLSKWFGETEQLLGDLFEAAKSHPRSVVFFDEAEALFPKRGGSNSSVMARVVPQLLQLINGLDPNQNCIILLGATNRPWLMDEAATRPGRFGRLVFVGPPDPEARAYMIERAMRDTPVADLDYQALAERTQGYSGADLAGDRDSLCVEAKMAALKRTVDAVERAGEGDVEPEPVTMDDFEHALERIRPSIKAEDLQKFEQFREQHDKA